MTPQQVLTLSLNRFHYVSKRNNTFYYNRLSRGFSSNKKGLQHIYLDILSPGQCKVFAKDINPGRELCAAKKILPSLKVFTDSGEEFSEVPEDQLSALKIVPSVLQNSTLGKVGFVIGGGDTCQVGYLDILVPIWGNSLSVFGPASFNPYAWITLNLIPKCLEFSVTKSCNPELFLTYNKQFPATNIIFQGDSGGPLIKWMGEY